MSSYHARHVSDIATLLKICNSAVVLAIVGEMGDGLFGCLVGVLMLPSKLTIENIFSTLISFNHACKNNFSGAANEELSSQISIAIIIVHATSSIKIKATRTARSRSRSWRTCAVKPTCPPGVNDNLMELILLISMRRT